MATGGEFYRQIDFPENLIFRRICIDNNKPGKILKRRVFGELKPRKPFAFYCFIQLIN